MSDCQKKKNYTKYPVGTIVRLNADFRTMTNNSPSYTVASLVYYPFDLELKVIGSEYHSEDKEHSILWVEWTLSDKKTKVKDTFHAKYLELVRAAPPVFESVAMSVEPPPAPPPIFFYGKESYRNH